MRRRRVPGARRAPGALLVVPLVALLAACGSADAAPAGEGAPVGGEASSAAPATGAGSSSDPASTGASPTTGAAAPAGLSASVVQYRRDAQRGVLQVKVRNDGDEAVEVTRVRLDTTTFTGPVTADKSSRVGAGVAADLTVPLGEPACDVAASGGGEHSVTLEVDGTTVVLPVGDEVLGPVAAERCAAVAVADQVALAVAPAWQDAGEVRGEPSLRGTVVATPQPGAGALRLAVEGATTLFTVAEPSAAELPPAATAPVTLPVVLSVTRCDPHAVAEDKKGYLLPVRVSVDGAEEVLVEVAVPVPERGPLQELIDRTCGFP